MTHITQVCSNFHLARVFIRNTRPDEANKWPAAKTREPRALEKMEYKKVLKNSTRHGPRPMPNVA